MHNLKTTSFSKLIKTNHDLMSFRNEYSKKTAKQRRLAAQWQYDTEVADDIFSTSLPMLSNHFSNNKKWDAGVISLAIDPLYAPALLTVGSLEYQYKRISEAMALFLKLTKLSTKEPDLPEIIDKAGDFLIYNEDFNNALVIYTAAEQAFPKEALYYVGSGYCLSKLKRYELSLEKHKIAVTIEPNNCRYLNDLGFTLYEAGYAEEAIKIIEKAITISPPDYDLPEGNLKYIKKEIEKHKSNKTKKKIASKE